MEVGSELAVDFVINAQVDELARRLVDIFEDVAVHGDIAVFDGYAVGGFEDFARVIGGEGEAQFADTVGDCGVKSAFDGGDLEAAVALERVGDDDLALLPVFLTVRHLVTVGWVHSHANDRGAMLRAYLDRAVRSSRELLDL